MDKTAADTDTHPVYRKPSRLNSFSVVVGIILGAVIVVIVAVISYASMGAPTP